MGWRLAADVVLLVHLAFVLVVAVGGFLCWRWPRFAWVQLPTAVYGVVIQLVGFTCPLTPIEKSLRRRAGEAGYDGGFVEHYIVGLLYPGEFTPTVAALLAAGVIAANAVAYGVLFARRRERVRNAATSGSSAAVAATSAGRRFERSFWTSADAPVSTTEQCTVPRDHDP